MTDVSIGIELPSGPAVGGARQIRNSLALIAQQGKETNRLLAAGQNKVQREFKETGVAARKAGLDIGNAGGKFKAFALSAVAGFSAIGGLRSVGKTIADFESTLSGVQAVTRATAGDMQSMEKVARELGATTKFSASEAAAGMQFLGMAGFQTNEIVSSMPALLDLAAAGALDLASAADIASNIMSGFGIEASRATEVADALALTAASSNTNIQQLGEGMKFVAPIARSMGLSMQDTSAAMGALGNAGIQGSLGGTNLRMALVSLLKPSKEAQETLASMGLTIADVNPEMLAAADSTAPLVDMLKNLERGGLDATKATQIFGSRAATAITALQSQLPVLENLTTNINNADGAAKEMADTMNDNVAGAALTLKSAMDETALAFGDTGFKAVMRLTLDSMTEAFRDTSAEADVWGSTVSHAIAFVMDTFSAMRKVTVHVFTTLGNAWGGVAATIMRIMKGDFLGAFTTAEETVKDFGKAVLTTADLDLDKYRRAVEEAQLETEKLTPKTDAATTEVKKLGKAAEETAKKVAVMSGEVKQAMSDAADLFASFFPTSAKEQALADIDELRKAFADGLLPHLTQQDIDEAAREHMRRYYESASNAGEPLAKKAGKEAGGFYAKATDRAFERVDDAFRDFWRDALDGGLDSFEGFADALEDIFKDMLAEMAQAALRANILDPIMQGLSGKGFDFSALKGNIKGLTGAVSGGGALGTAGGLAAGGAALAGHGALVGSLFDSLAGGGSKAQDGAAIGTLAGPMGQVIGAVVGAFMGEWETKSKDIAVTMVDGVVEATGILVQRKDRIGSHKRRDVETALSDEAQAVFDNLTSTATAALHDFGDALGADVGSALKRVSIDLRGNADDFGEIIVGATEDMILQVVPFIQKFALEGENLGDTLQRVTANAVTVNDALGLIGKSLDDAAISFGRLPRVVMMAMKGIEDTLNAELRTAISETLSNSFGGAQGFAAAMSGFVNTFLPEAEKLDIAVNRLGEGFAALNIAVPQSRDEFAALVQGVDVVDEASAGLLAGLLHLAPLADQVFTALESAAVDTAPAVDDVVEAIEDVGGAFEDTSEAILEQLKALARFNDALRDVGDSIARTRVGQQGGSLALFDIGQIMGRIFDTSSPVVLLSLMDELHRAMVSRYDEERRLIEDNRSDALDALYNQRDAIRDQIRAAQELRDISRSLRDFGKDLLVSDLSPLVPIKQLEEAQRRLFQMANAARAGDVGAARELEGQSTTVLELARSIFASGPQFQAIFGTVQGMLEGVADQLDNAQAPDVELLDSIDAQIAETNRLFDEQINSLKDGLLASLGDISALLDLVAQLQGVQDSGDSMRVGELIAAIGAGAVDVAREAGLTTAAVDSLPPHIDGVAASADATADAAGGIIAELQGKILDHLTTVAADMALVPVNIGGVDTTVGTVLTALDERVRTDLQEIASALGERGAVALATAGVDTTASAIETSTADALVVLRDQINTELDDIMAALGLQGAVALGLGDVDSAVGGVATAVGETAASAADTTTNTGATAANSSATAASALLSADRMRDAVNNIARLGEWNSALMTSLLGAANDINEDIARYMNLDQSGTGASYSHHVPSKSGSMTTYALGGIANEPSIFGEAGPEAAVPLPDGRTIPVTLSGGGDAKTQELLGAILTAVTENDGGTFQIVSDGRKVVDMSLRELRERSKRGEKVVFKQGVS